jgi:hypothetical protein
MKHECLGVPKVGFGTAGQPLRFGTPTREEGERRFALMLLSARKTDIAGRLQNRTIERDRMRVRDPFVLS